MIYNRITVCLLILGCLFHPVQAGEAVKADPLRILKADLNAIFADRRLAQAQVGIAVFSLTRGEMLYEKNSAQLYIPASCNKIITAAAALSRLGPEYHFETRVLTDGKVQEGELKGNLVIIGSGDPTNSPRFHGGDPFGVFKKWAAILKEMEIRKISGDILGSVAAFHGPKFGFGWEWEDLTQSYAAPVSALQFNENMVRVEITPGAMRGSPAVINSFPVAGYPVIENGIVTDSEKGAARIKLEYGESSEVLEARGTIPLKSAAISRNIAVRRPTHYYLSAFKSVLAGEGIDLEESEIKEIKTPANQATLLVVDTSPSLSEILKPLLKESLNLYAEILPRTLGLVFRNEGSFDMGKEVIEETLEKMGVEKDTYRYADGSGLSRLNLQSPDTFIRVLRYMHKSRHFHHFYDALPIAGKDGTLEPRMKGTRAEYRVRAKTGTISSVSSISGYLECAGGELLAFAVIINNYPGKKTAAEAVQDKALEYLVNFSRK